ncbi:MAG: capsid cement protein [Planctomycetota bacterium]
MHAGYREGPTITVDKGATVLEPHRRLHNDSGNYRYAAIGELGNGVSELRRESDEGTVSLRLTQNGSGTVTCVCTEAITAGSVVYTAADGKVSSTSGGGALTFGVAMTTSAAADELIEILPTVNSAAGGTARSGLTQDALAKYAIPLEDCAQPTAPYNALPPTPTTSLWGYVAGTHGTSAPALRTADFGGTSSAAALRVTWTVPPEYDPGESLTFQVNAEFLTVPDANDTIDIVAVRRADPSTDLYAGSAQQVGDTAANELFVLDATNVVVGDVIDIVLTANFSDSGNAAADITGQINEIAMLADIKG